MYIEVFMASYGMTIDRSENMRFDEFDILYKTVRTSFDSEQQVRWNLSKDIWNSLSNFH